MLRKITTHQISLVIFSSLLLVLSFPGFDLELLAWVALVPLFFAIEHKKPSQAFRVSYIVGLLFFLGTIYWLMHVTLPGMIILSFYLALYFGLFGTLTSYALKRYPPLNARGAIISLFLIPAIWVGTEWLRSNFLSGFGWVLIGYSQSYDLPMIQIADITGVYGVSFLVVMVNFAVYFTLKNFFKKKIVQIPAAVTIAVLFLTLTYGIFRLNNIFTGEGVRVGIVQGNIPQDKKWDVSFRDYTINKYEEMTKALAKDNPDLIIWPETAIPSFLESEPELFQRVKSLAEYIHTPLLVGTPREDRRDQDKYYNSAVLFSGEGNVEGTYDKIHLVPFGEYVPLKKVFSFVEKLASGVIGDFSAGRNYTLLRFFIERKISDKKYRWKMIKKIGVGTLICFEDVFPQISRRYANEGASLLVNMTNDAWYKKTSAAFQHMQCSVFRAVENRMNVVRATNTGVSCFINPKGRVVDMLNKDGESLFVDAVKADDIVVGGVRTYYDTYGDLFAYLCMILVLFFLLGKKNGFRIY